MTSCQTCGASLPVAARFCPSCGASVARVDAQGSRRPVTVVFTDLVGSTALGERLDAETLGGLMDRFYATMRGAVEHHGGAVEKFIGDAVVATFGAPEIHEDDALRAVRAAHEMHAVLAALNDELARRWDVRLEVRTGVATGDVLAGGGAAVLGSPANLAARLQAEAGTGEILLAPDTERLVRGHVRTERVEPIEIKGFEEPIRCFRSLGLYEGPASAVRSPLVGREQELALLDLAYRRAVRDRKPQLATVLGEPGIGKTRLVDEAVARLEGDPRVLRGRCLPYGEGITFFPISEVVSAAAGINRGDDAGSAQAKVTSILPRDAATVAARVSEAIGLGGPPAAPEETLWAIRRFFELLAADRALVLVFDDLQWAEPAFLDLLQQIIERTRGVAELVIAMARPELFEQRPGWAGGTANAVTVSLEPLTTHEGMELARHAAAAADFDDPAAARIASTAGGNPLFLEEYVTMLIDDGILLPQEGRWRLPDDLESLGATPPTLTGLLTARLLRLPQAERETLVAASVIGKAFTDEDLAALLDTDQVSRDVERLLHMDLIVPTQGSTTGSFEFRHQLLRDAAYASLPKSRRATLHERFAGYLEQTLVDRPEEFDELAGYHLAEAHDFRIELGARDEHTDELADRAARRLSVAGTRAVGRGDPRAGVRLLRRASDLTRDPLHRAAVRLRLSNAYADTGDAGGLDATLNAGLADAVAAGDERLRTRFEHLRIVNELLTAPSTHPIEAVAERLSAQAATLASLGDIEGVAECHYQLATLAWIRADADAFERWARQAYDDAIACGDARLIARSIDYVLISLLRGPTTLDDAIAELRSIRDGVDLGRRALANIRLGEAEMLAYLDRGEEAAGLVEDATDTFRELGVAVDLATAESVRAIVADAGGDLDGAERALRSSYDRFRAMGDLANAGLVAVDLAEILARLGREDEAESLALAAAAVAAEPDIEVQVGWRLAMARVHAARSDPDRAFTMIEEADTLLAQASFTMLRADSLSTTGEVLAALGRREPAIGRLREATGVYEAKGQLVGAQRTRKRLAEIGRQSS
jgi:class 3 adenylate cyclase/tetratricopeptide (TPR) repeat protein